MFYAQINESKICVGVSALDGKVEDDRLVKLECFNVSLLGKKYDNGQWVETETEVVTNE